VDRSYVDGLEQQEENPTVDVLDRLAKMLEVPISEFFKTTAQGGGTTEAAPLQRGALSLREQYPNWNEDGGRVQVHTRRRNGVKFERSMSFLPSLACLSILLALLRGENLG